ncbi:hypothetical protein [Lichenihabitans psoromatis]|uniref:hypothetical protein n=1 Tax=Lichenihabitans psoromatis TaxID=2528642 RepID=UPI0010357BBF|nr:hypothetical protein [Lichenihabitans psoromatis]
MIEAIAAVQQLAAAKDPVPAGVQSVDVSSQAVQRPNATEAADFAEAAGRTAHEVPAAAPSSTDSLATRLAHQADAMASRLKIPEGFGQAAKTTQPEAPVAANDSMHTPGFDKENMTAAVSQMERAYMFAIETTMASRGSTESTKIFNTLLKGQ